MPDQDDIEFATKEDLELIEKSPELKKVYNAMKAGVTKKFQEWGEKNKSSKTLEARLKQLEDKLFEWEDWYAEAFPEGWSPDGEGEPREFQEGSRGKSNPKGRGNEPSIQDIIDAINKGAASFERRLQTLTDKQDRLSNAFTLSLDLVEQKFAHPEMDIQKVLKTAQEKGVSDIGAAYDFAYKDELLRKQVDEGIEKGLKEKEAERKKTLETGSGSIPVTFERPKEVPKSFTEATSQFMKERATEGQK